MNIRKYYGLTRNELSALLGWGDITVTRYETKALQDDTYDNLMRMVLQNPMFAIECLEKNKTGFTPKKYSRIKKNIIVRVREEKNLYWKKQEIHSQYLEYEKENEFNGFKILDIDKVANVIGYFAQFTECLFKVKLMKLLWYSDFLFFKRHGKSMTGLVYTHMPLGALPIGYDEIIHLSTVKVEQKFICNDISYKILPGKDVNISDFTLEEMSVLDTVASKFKSFKAEQMINYMHEEKAYMDTSHGEPIPYSMAKHLNELD